MVAVAQLVESRIVIPVVVGSSPISPPTYKEITEIIFKNMTPCLFVLRIC